MPFALIIVGLLLVVAAVRNTVTDNGSQKGLTTLVKGDFTGQNNFIYWSVSILVIGALGYIDSLKAFSRIFMALIVVALFLKGNQGASFFSNFQSALSSLGQDNFSDSLSNLVGNSGATPTSSNTNSSGSVSNLPVDLGGIQGSFTGDLSALTSAVNQGVIEAPLSSGRNQ